MSSDLISREVLPCPFCGSTPEAHPTDDWFACTDKSCPAYHWWAALDQWNRRSSVSLPVSSISEEERKSLRRRHRLCERCANANVNPVKHCKQCMTDDDVDDTFPCPTIRLLNELEALEHRGGNT